MLGWQILYPLSYLASPKGYIKQHTPAESQGLTASLPVIVMRSWLLQCLSGNLSVPHASISLFSSDIADLRTQHLVNV